MSAPITNSVQAFIDRFALVRPALCDLTVDELHDEWLWCEVTLRDWHAVVGRQLDEFDEAALRGRMRAIERMLGTP